MTRPSDRAIAQAFYEVGAGNSEQAIGWQRIERRAREIDAAAPEGAPESAREFYGWVITGPNGSMFVPQSHPLANDLVAATPQGGATCTTVPIYTAPPSLDADDAARLAAIGELIRTQDNRITDSPIFIVQQRRRIYGIEDGYCENFVWIDGDNSYTDEERAVRDAERAENEEAEVEYRQCGYIDIWEFVTACFTEQGCKDYLKRDGHNLREPRIYAAGSYRNEEWRFVRKQLLSIAARAAEGKGNG